MARPYPRFNAATIKKWIAEGRGQGHGKNYAPWLRARDVPSNGYVNRILGWKTTRRHEFLSNLEASYFYLLEWSPFVSDVREQFPLNLDETSMKPSLLRSNLRSSTQQYPASASPQS
jgi:hypothetical protein